jgi:hypothetical protein
MSLQDEVVQLLELAGYSVRTTPLVPSDLGTSLEVLKATSTGVTSRSITILNDPNQLGTLVRSPGLRRDSWVVLPDNLSAPLPSALLQQMARRRIEPLTLTLFYDRMLRATDICAKTLSATVRWKDEDIGPDRLAQLFVPQRAKVVQDSQERVEELSSVFVTSSLTGPTTGAVVFVLADAGRGKTWLTWHLAYEAAQKYLAAVAAPQPATTPPPPIPILIPFSQYKRLTSFDGIILERLNALGTLDIRAEGFQHLLSKGRVVLILDGFDEMLELAPAHARENLVEIRRHMRGLSRLILTSRSSVFPTKEALANFAQLTGSEVEEISLVACYLQPFTQDQIDRFHLARGASAEELDSIRRLPLDPELLRSPQVAEYFLDLVRTNAPLNQQDLFGTILPLIYKRESSKWEKEGSPPMPNDLQAKFLTEISLVMWPGGSADPELVQIEADSLGHSSLSKHHLLQPTLDGQLQFEHHVWRDWFMAQGIRARLDEGAWTSRAIADCLSEPLPDYCVTLLGEMLPEERVGLGVRDDSLGDSPHSNLLRIAISRIPGGDAAARAAHLLRLFGSPKALAFRGLQGIQFYNFDLRNWDFDRTRFDKTIFSFCTLPRKYEEVFTGARGPQLFDCKWWPDTQIDEATIQLARDELRRVINRFVMSSGPQRVRDEISKDQMSREFRIGPDNKALRCLLQGRYVRIALQAGSKEYYVLERGRLDELLRFIRDGVGLQTVIGCMTRDR